MPSEYRLQNLFFKTKFGWVLQGTSVISESRGLRWEDHRLDREPSRQALCCGQMNGWVKIPSIHIKRQVQWPALVILEAGKLRQEDL